MIASFLSTAVLCTMTAFACPTEKAAGDCSGAKVQNVALESDAKDCSSPCSDAKMAACSGDTAVVTSVATKTEAKSDCPLACSAGQTAAVTNVAMATDAKDCSTPCSDDQMAKMAACGDKSGFAVPSMAYRVGDTDVACPVSAKAMAAEHKADMGFVVQGVVYQTEAEAKVAHMVAMQQFTESLTRVSLVVNGETVECAEKAAACKDACDSTKVQYQVGPVMFDNAEDAVRAAAAAHAAMTSVKMSYAVNGEATYCSVDAKAKSTSCGSPVEFVVNGAKTACTKTADYLLTQERMAAAVAAMQKAIG